MHHHATGIAASSRFDQELTALAKNLDTLSFRALSPGIGLGELRPRTAKPEPSAAARASAVPREGGRALVNEVAPLREKGVKVKPAKAVKPEKVRPEAGARPLPLPFERRLFAWAIDFLFVGASLATAFSLATVLAAVRAGDGRDILSLAPIQWLAAWKPLELLAGVYGAFLAYFLVFKLVAGASFGESLQQRTRLTQKLPTERREALGENPGNDALSRAS